MEVIAYYLPQYYPFKENNEWWGEGFTEWVSVKQSSKIFKNHYQPHVPSEFGYYDLKEIEVMKKQAEMAKQYGVYGFCYYYYWFGGKKLLEKPLENLLSETEPSFPFCLCWANENWTRRWDGLDQEVLISQDYEDGWVENYFNDILPFLKDERYIKVAGKPLLLLYRIDNIPDSVNVIHKWKQMAKEEGLAGIHIAGIQYIGMSPDVPITFGADASVEFPPHMGLSERSLVDPSSIEGISEDFDGHIEDYRNAMINYTSRESVDIPWYRTLMPAWDNTPRRKFKSHIYINSSPELYEEWLSYIVDYSHCAPNGKSIMFVNAWNEWAEGAYIEPDTKYGRQYLEATSQALRGYIPVNRTLPYENKSHEHISNSSGFLNYESIKKKMVKSISDLKKKLVYNPLLPFCNEAFITSTIKRYGMSNTNTLPPLLSYATVRDFCDSWDNLNPISQHGDLKNVQRPWALKTILSQVPLGGKLLEFGGGQPIIAATLSSMGYDVTIVDPYDGTGNGPTEYERYLKEFPEVRLIRGYFQPSMLELHGEEGSFDAVYSISVIEHIPLLEMRNVFAAMRLYLRPTGFSMHAIDFIRRGEGDAEHRKMIFELSKMSGISEKEVQHVLLRMDDDIETYYLSAEAHNSWRMGLTYEEFKMRVCVSLQLCTSVSRVN